MTELVRGVGGNRFFLSVGWSTRVHLYSTWPFFLFLFLFTFYLESVAIELFLFWLLLLFMCCPFGLVSLEVDGCSDAEYCIQYVWR